jgi:hypothetical protein
MTDAERVRRADAAKRLLEDALMAEAFASVRTAILQRIEDAPLRDRDGVHELKLMLKLLRDVRGNLETFIRDGKIAALHIEEERKKRRFGIFP